MQLAAFNNNNFALGHTAMTINEGLPLYLVHRLEQRFDLSSMTVGILGMAFKGESDDIRSSLSYKLKRVLEFKADAVLCTDPYVTVDPNLLPQEEVIERSDVLIIAAPHPQYRDLVPTSRSPTSGTCSARGVRDMTGEAPRVSVVVPAYNESEHIIPVLDRIFESVRLQCEVLVVVDSADDTTVPVVAEYASKEPRLRCIVNTYGRGPANAIRYGIDAAAAPVAVVTMADGCDDPRQIDDLARLVDRGVAVAAASRYMPGGQQVGGPMLKGLLSKLAGPVARAARAHRHPGRHELVQGVLDRVRARGRHRLPRGLRDRHRAHRQGAADAAAGGGDPTIWLDRQAGMSNFKVAQWIPGVPAVVPVRVRSTAHRRAGQGIRPENRKGKRTAK